MPPSSIRSGPSGASLRTTTLEATPITTKSKPSIRQTKTAFSSTRGSRRDASSSHPAASPEIGDSTNTVENPGNSSLMSPPIMSSSSSPYYGGLLGGGGMYGGAYGGVGGMMMPPPIVGGGPLSGLNQFLFGIQTLLFSLGQAVQIVGMNTQAFQQLLDAATTMMDHALTTWRDMRALEQQARDGVQESEQDQKRRRRLRALRWAMVMGVAYAGYRLIRRILQARSRRRLLTQQQQQQQPYQHDGSTNSAATQQWGHHHDHNYGAMVPATNPYYAGTAGISPWNQHYPYSGSSYGSYTGTPPMNPYGGAGYY